MIRKGSYHVTYLETASEGILKFSRSEQYMKWVVQSLFIHVKPTHVSIALYDGNRKFYPVQYSSGKGRYPTQLVALDGTSPIVNCFHHNEGQNSDNFHFDRPITYKDFMKHITDESPKILREMELYHVEVCAKIETQEKLVGYLLIGPREDGTLYNMDDINYFQAIANDVAIEIQKEEYMQGAHIDPLTGLLNRHSLTAKAENVMALTRDNREMFALAMIDLDHFKNINDTYGHLVGDQVLRVSAGIIRESIRESDFPFRYGGEEFLLMMRMVARDPAKAKVSPPIFRQRIYEVMERLRAKISARPLQCFKHEIPVTISIGVTFFNASGQSNLEDLIREADLALYTSKNNGRNRTTLWGTV